MLTTNGERIAYLEGLRKVYLELEDFKTVSDIQATIMRLNSEIVDWGLDFLGAQGARLYSTGVRGTSFAPLLQQCSTKQTLPNLKEN